MKESEKKPYLNDPMIKETTKEQILYGDGETLEEKENKKKESKDKILNE